MKIDDEKTRMEFFPESICRNLLCETPSPKCYPKTDRFAFWSAKK